MIPEQMDYNTGRVFLGMKEYGRHVQKMVDFLLTIEDREKRQQQTQYVIELMGFLNPHLKSVEDFRHKLWDHLFFISISSWMWIVRTPSLPKKPINENQIPYLTPSGIPNTRT